MAKSALGKGLSALISTRPPAVRLEAEPGEKIQQVDLASIVPSPLQPRKNFAQEALGELVESIRQHGIIQPLVVRNVGGKHELIAGERRWRAAQEAGLAHVPIITRVATDLEVLELSLIENLQRADLNPIEEAQAYRRLVDEYQLTQEQIADAVGKDRSSVANFLRLLKLPHEVRANVGAGTLSMGHARALLGLPDEASQLRLSREVVSKSLSVRETEALVKKGTAPVKLKTPAESDVHTRAAEERMRFALGTRVRILRKRTGGRIEIEFGSEAELQRLFEILTDGK
jgi:ParB family chromosome partitioning protein